MLACQRYIELNPVRAVMVSHPAEYRWSSYRANAQGETDLLLKPHSLYEALGTDAASRQATNGNYALGNEGFSAQVTAALGRRATPGKSGRPRRKPEPE